MERTLSIIKPDGVGKGLTGEIVRRLEQAGFRICAMKMVRLTGDQARMFYSVHRGRPFYDSLVEFMTSGPIVAMVIEGENAVRTYRELMGATNPKEALPGTIRRDFAGDVEKNIVHGSDAPETAAQEIRFFFNELEIHF
ncbi:MAG: nucleoside-diphosphate kinase [Syntrophobacteraceae bacterium]|jgi:nucleoside-diphosphate kinase